MKKSLLSLVIGTAVSFFPLAAMAFTPMSETALKSTTGQAADSSTEELLQAYYKTFGYTEDGLPNGAYGEDDTIASGDGFGDLGILSWAYRFLKTNPDATPSILAAIEGFNTSGTNVADQLSLPQITSVILELPKLVIIAPKASYTIVLSTNDGEDDDKSFGAVSREASLMAIQSGIVEIAGH